MPVGGSVTHGVGSSDQSGYRKTLLQLLCDMGFNARMVGSRRTGAFDNNQHEGWRGFRIEQIETRARPSAEKLRPHIFTVNAGSNDCLQDFRLLEASDRLGGLLESLWLASPGSTAIVSSLLVNRDEAVDMRVTAFNREVEAMVAKKAAAGGRIVFVNMHADSGPTLDDLGEDGTHPNDAGYNKMARIWIQGIREALDRGYLPHLSLSQGK